MRDSPEWWRAIGMAKAPDHNTLCRAARFLLGASNGGKLLDVLAALARALRLSTQPLAIDSTYYELCHLKRYHSCSPD